MYFKSDNTTGVCPEIIESIIKMNTGHAEPYGMDFETTKLKQKISTLFEAETAVFLVSTGTVANALALAAITPTYGSIFCHTVAHIYTDECGAPQFFNGGAKTVVLQGSNGKINPQNLINSLESTRGNYPRENKPSTLSITQGTEKGTVYTLDEIRYLSSISKRNKMRVHMDGARFTNALVSLGCTPAEMTWKSGVDVLCLGATKNGALAAETIIFFDLELAKDFEFRLKQAGQTFSKSRFFSTQMNALFRNQLWLKNASNANRMAKMLKNSIMKSHLATLSYPVEINEVFVKMPLDLVDHLIASNVIFYQMDGDCRFVTSFLTTEGDITNLETLISAFKHSPYHNIELMKGAVG